jgi:hypothetical protein
VDSLDHPFMLIRLETLEFVVYWMPVLDRMSDFTTMMQLLLSQLAYCDICFYYFAQQVKLHFI